MRASLNDQLIKAARLGCVKALKIVLEKGADPLYRCSTIGLTPFEVATGAMHKECVQILQQCIENTQLLIAAYHGCARAAKSALEKGADPLHRCPNSGRTPLDVATAAKHQECVRVLCMHIQQSAGCGVTQSALVSKKKVSWDPLVRTPSSRPMIAFAIKRQSVASCSTKALTQDTGTRKAG